MKTTFINNNNLSIELDIIEDTIHFKKGYSFSLKPYDFDNFQDLKDFIENNKKREIYILQEQMFEILPFLDKDTSFSLTLCEYIKN